MNQSLRCFLFTLALISLFFSSYSTNFHIKVFAFLVLKNNDTIPSSDALNFFVSNRGSDTNDGRSPNTPKLRISSIQTLLSSNATGGSVTSLNLDDNSSFREEYDPANNNLYVNSFSLKSPIRLAKITGMDIIREWDATPANNNVYQYLLKHSIELSGPAYNYIMVAEIDTVLETTRPISAVKYLTLVSNIAQCNSTPGSYYVPNVTINPLMVYMHPSEGAPGKNKFRYEVTTRNYNINAGLIDNATYNGLLLQTAGNGYGMLSAGKNSSIKNCIFQGGGTHHTVVKSGHIDSCLFIAGPKGLQDRIAAVFYNSEGEGANNKITNTIFLNVPNAVYTHTNGSINHKSLLLDKVYAFADSTDAVNGLSANNTDSIEVNNCYVEGYPTGWWYGGGTKLNIQNSIFRKTNQSGILAISNPNAAGELKVNNVLIETNGNDDNQNLANGWTAYGIRSPYNNTNIEVTNTIIHGFSTWHESNVTVSAFQFTGLIKANHNIYICDVNDKNSMHIYNGSNSGGIGTSANVTSNYNVFVLLRGTRFHWMVNPNNNNDQDIYTLSEWQSLTGQDKNSIVIDLRNNPLGLKAVFVDPDNGNWTLTQTIQADSIRKISAGMTTPPLFYPKRPLVDNEVIPFKTPGGFSSFSGILRSESETVVKWSTFNESDVSSFIIEYSLDGTHFTEAGSLSPLNNSNNNDYQYIHAHYGTDSIFYRLKCIYSDSTSLYSSVIKLYSDFSQEFKITIYPNPFQQTITVEHPRRNLGEIRIFDNDGRLIKTFTVIPRSSRTLISLTNLPAGHYFVQWTSNQEKLNGTIIK